MTPAAERRLRVMRELAAMRKNNPIITEGKTEWLTVGDSDHLIAYTRAYEGKTITVVVNTAPDVIESTVDFAMTPDAKVLLQKDLVVTAKDEKLHFAANPGGYIVIEQ